jgi:elongation factor G
MADLTYLRNIGISAHIDAGKTTLTERILFYTGKIHKTTEVRDKGGGGATMDSMELEREKGITIQSAATYIEWGDYAVNIIDTPGHVDFTIEVERALRVLDGGILVLDSVAGVQSQTLTVDRQMRRYNVPRLAFVNKCDKAGADPLRVCNDLREKLGLNAFMVQHPIGLEDKHEGVVDLISMKALYFEGMQGEEVREAEIPDELKEVCAEQREKLIEGIADLDDEIAMLFLEEEEIPEDKLRQVIRRETITCEFVPVHLGSAYKNKGVQPLLDNVVDFLPHPLEMTYYALDQDNEEEEVKLEPDPDKPLVMLAFKLEDGRYGQLTYCRIYQGSLKKGDTILNTSSMNKTKVGRLVRMHSNDMHDVEEAEAGGIVALFGIDCASGDTFTNGNNMYTMTSMYVPEPVITLAVEPKNREGQQNFSKALNRFSKEDPTFRVSRDEESGQTIIGGMGELHLQVYIERIKREYGVEVEVGAPQVAYRETITKHQEFDYTHKKQSGGSGQYGRVVGYLEPNEEENYTFLNDIVGGVIPKDYQPACDKGFQDAMEKGSLIGFPVVNITACINDGDNHAVDSSDMAFRIASRQAFKQAYRRANPCVLEPVMKVEVETPEEFQGNVIGGLNKRRGLIIGTHASHGQVVIETEVPLSEMFGYSNDLRSSTQGKAEFSMEFKKYAPVPSNIQEELIEKYRKEEEDE